MIELSEEQRMLAKTTSDFAAAELTPKAAEVDETEDFNLEAFRNLGKLGLLGITVSEEYGGAGLGCTEATLVMEKLAEHCASTTLSYLAHSILCVNNLYINGSDEQKKKYLPGLISGERIGGMGMTEPGAGSDMLSMSTKAKPSGNGYIVSGTKTFITNGTVGDLFILYAKTGETKKHISTFLIEKDFPGFSVGKKLKKLGMRGSPTSELIFDQCQVPKQNRVGEENDSIAHMMKNLNLERITISGLSLGLASAALEYSKKYVKERKQFGKALAEFQVTQHKIAEMATHLDAARALVYNAAQAFDAGRDAMSLGGKAKLFSAQAATWICMEAVQLLGGYGYTKEYPVERYVRDAKLMEIGAGTNEIMRMLIARDELDL